MILSFRFIKPLQRIFEVYKLIYNLISIFILLLTEFMDVQVKIELQENQTAKENAQLGDENAQPDEQIAQSEEESAKQLAQMQEVNDVRVEYVEQNAAIEGPNDIKMEKSYYDPDARTCKVPQITLAFWVIKCCATTVGETLSDYFASTLNLGLGNTSAIFYPALFVVLIIQFYVNRYIPYLYWLAVILMSICGTIFTDGIHDDLGLELWIEIVIFFVLMTTCFATWYRSEGTLDIHSIKTYKREAFYWLTILFTFALGTAVGDQISEAFMLGYGYTLLIFVVVIFLIFAMWYLLKLDDIVCFWIAYIMTRPLGAAAGDLLAASADEGAAGLGTTNTSLIFLGIIALIVGVLTYTKYDQIKSSQVSSDIVKTKIYEAVPQQAI